MSVITPEYLAKSRTEHGEQSAVFCWAGQNFRKYPVLRWMHAIPNGGGRSPQQGLALKMEGVKGGVADIHLPVVKRYVTNVCAGLYIEMKRANGIPSDVSDAQLEFGKFVTVQGYRWVVCFGWQQAVRLLGSYLDNDVYQMSQYQIAVDIKLRELIQIQSDWQI